MYKGDYFMGKLILYLVIGLIIGLVIGFFLSKIFDEKTLEKIHQ